VPGETPAAEVTPDAGRQRRQKEEAEQITLVGTAYAERPSTLTHIGKKSRRKIDREEQSKGSGPPRWISSNAKSI